MATTVGSDTESVLSLPDRDGRGKAASIPEADLRFHVRVDPLGPLQVAERCGEGSGPTVVGNENGVTSW